MSSIDNRIVVLTFDNKDFERNVQTSMNTLDKLKNGLNLEGASKGLTALSASAKSFNLSPIGSAIEAIRDRFSNLGVVGFTVLQNLTNTAINFGKNIISSLVSPLTSGGWKRALDIEQATFQMEGLLLKTEGGAKKIQAIMTEVQESVKGTAFGANEAARVASQLVATGVEDAQQMRTYLDGVAGAAAMTGGAYDEIGHIFTTVAGQGKLMGEQLNQFAYRGLNVAATLSRQMGITEAEFRDLVRQGEISFDMFAAGMAEAFGDQAVKANETFTGSLANMRAALARIGQDVATPALTYLRDLFNSLRLLIDAVHERLKPFIDTLNNKLTNAAKRATSFVDSLTEALGGVSARMKKEMEGTAEATEEAAETITQSTEEIEEMARRVIAGEFGNGEERRRQLEELGYSYEEVQNKVNELLGCDYRYEVQAKETTELIKQQAEETENLTVKTQTLSQALGSEIFQNFYFAVLNIKKALEQFGSAIKKSFLKVFDARNGEKILIRIRNISDAFLEFTQSLLLNGDEQKGLQVILEGVFYILDKLLKGVLKGVEWFLKFATVVANITKGFLGFIGALANFNGEVDEASRKSRFIGALAGVFSKLGEAIKGFKDKLVEVFERVQNTGGFIKLKRVLTELWQTIKEIAGKVFDKLIEKMNQFAGTDLSFDWMDGLVSLLGKAAGKLASFFEWINNGIPRIGEFFRSIKDGTNDSAFGKFINFFIQAKDAVVEFFKGLFGGTDENGEKLSLFETIKKMFQDGISNVGEFFGGIKTEGFVNGFKTFISNIAESIRSLDTQTVLDFLKSVGKIIMQIVLFASIVKFLRSASGMMSGIGAFFSGIGGYFKNLASTAKATIVLIAIGELIAALYVISKIPSEDLLRSVIALGAIVGGVILALKVVDSLNLNDAKMKSFAIAMAGLGTGLLALSGAMVILSKFTWIEFLSSAGKLAILIGMLVAASKLAGNAKCAAAFMGLAVAVNLLVPALAILGHFKWSTILKAAVALGLIVTELGVASRIAGNVKAAAAFMGLAVAVNLLVPAFGILGKFKWKTIQKGAVALGIIVGEVAIACRIASSPDALKGAVAFLAITVPLVAAIIGIKVLGNMERDKLIQGAVALGSIILAIAAATRLAKDLDLKSIVAMVGVLAIAIAGLYVLKDAPWQSLLSAGAALSAVMLSLAGAMNIAEGVKPNVAGFAAMLIPLAGAVAGLWILGDTPWQSLLAGGAALSMVILSCAEALKIAADAQPLAALSLDLVTGGVLVIALSLTQLTDYNWQNLLGAATGLSEVLLACSIAMRIMYGMNPAIAAITALSIDAALAIIGGFVVAFTGILGKIDDWRNGGLLESVQKGKEILEAVGEAIGAFIGGIGEGITGTLPTMADNLSSFAEKLTPFFETMKGFGTDIADTISTLALALLEITGAEFIDGITSFISGESSLSQFGSELETFAPALKNFWLNCKSIKDGDLTGAANALHDIATAAGTIPNEGLSVMSVLVGDNTLGGFAPQLLTFGPALKNFWLNCKTIKDGDLTGAANSLTEVATAAGSIPNEGLSVMSVLIGDNTLGRFGTELLTFGPALKNFWLNCKTIKDGDLTGAANSLAEIGKAAGEVPNQGLSMMKVIFGDNTLSKFGPELESFGPHLMAFAQSVAGIDSYAAAITVASMALKEICTSASEIPNQGWSVAKVFVGDNTLSKFGEELEKFGPHMSAFAESVKGIPVTKMITVAATMPSLVQMAVTAKDVKKSDLEDFGAGLKDFGEKLQSYYNSISGVSTSKIQQVIQTVYRLIEVGNEMALVDTGAMGNFGTALENVGKTGVDLFVAAFENSYDTARSAVNQFVQIGQEGADQFVTTLQAYAGSAYAAASYMASQAAAGASACGMQFYYAGQNAGYGMMNGLNSVADALYWTAYNIASAMAEAARAALRIFSPSREMFEIGDYAGQGLVMGLESKLKDVRNAGEEAADTILTSVAQPIDAIQDAIAKNIDVNPVITPVLDLTNLTQGAQSLSGMFDGATARVAIGGYGPTTLDSVMSLAEHLGSGVANSETVVNAINEIRSDVANLGAAITRMQIRLDGQTLVGEMVDPLDQALGERMDMRQRGLI